MKTVNANSVLGVMNLFNNEEYYKYAIDVLWVLRSIVLEEIKIEHGHGKGMSYDTKHPKFWIAEITNEIIGRALIIDYTYCTSQSLPFWYGERPRSGKPGFLTYDEASRIACIVNDEKLMDELYRLRDSVSSHANDKSKPAYDIYKVANDLIEALTGCKMLCA